MSFLLPCHRTPDNGSQDWKWSLMIMWSNTLKRFHTQRQCSEDNIELKVFPQSLPAEVPTFMKTSRLNKMNEKTCYNPRALNFVRVGGFFLREFERPCKGWRGEVEPFLFISELKKVGVFRTGTFCYSVSMGLVATGRYKFSSHRDKYLKLYFVRGTTGVRGVYPSSLSVYRV